MLNSIEHVELDFVDVMPLGNCKSAFLAMLADIVENKHYAVMLTYRCPYVIPQSIRNKVDSCVNIHPVSLPEFAGLNPWEKLKKTGKKQSEVILHVMDDIPDGGKILFRKIYKFDKIEEGRAISDIVASELVRDYLEQYG